MEVDKKARYERRQGAKDRRKKDSRRARRGNLGRTLLIAAGGLVAFAVVFGAFLVFVSFQKELPPTSFSPAHSEELPPRQINTEPIPRLIQEHVMERNSSHPAGRMLVQYNCEQYDCEPGLVDNLVEIVESYPSEVYLAPYPGMDAKIALAAPGRLETLDTFDEQRIRGFIRKNLDR